ncbi:MAG: hypothetical protein V1735_02875 [Nanoarchaeota archaeon]
MVEYYQPRVYRVEGAASSFAILLVDMQEPFTSFRAFALRMARDIRIPPCDRTTGGLPYHSEVHDYDASVLWNPAEPDTPGRLGCALIPKWLFEGGVFMMDVMTYGFQGYDQGTGCLISGIYHSRERKSGSVLAVASGLQKLPLQLEATLDRLVTSTGLEPVPLHDRDPQSPDFAELYRELEHELELRQQVLAHQAELEEPYSRFPQAIAYLDEHGSIPAQAFIPFALSHVGFGTPLIPLVRGNIVQIAAEGPN